MFLYTTSAILKESQFIYSHIRLTKWKNELYTDVQVCNNKYDAAAAINSRDVAARDENDITRLKLTSHALCLLFFFFSDADVHAPRALD